MYANKAYTAVLNASALTQENVQQLYGLLVTTWVYAADELDTVAAYDAILSGAVGIISDDTATLLDVACNKLPENTMTRMPLNVGHGGMPAYAPINTLEGSIAAYEAGADCIEMDLMLTKDGVVIANHDATTTTCNKELTVATCFLHIFCFVEIFCYALKVSKNKFKVNDFHIPNWVYRLFNVSDVAVFKTTNNVHDSVNFANMAQKFVAKTFAF